jgi:hypothetical protein
VVADPQRPLAPAENDGRRPHPVVARHYLGGLKRVERDVSTEDAVPGSPSIYFVIVFAGLAFELIRGHIRG